MILFDPITSQRTQITYKELQGITGKSLNTLYVTKTRGRKVPGLNSYLLDDDTPIKVMRDLMAKEDLKGEVWRHIPGSTYSVSNYGRYISKTERGEKFCLLSSKEAMITIRIRGQQRKIWGHSKVAEMFLKSPGEGYMVYHKDYNSYNCRVENLGYLPRHEARARIARTNLSKVVLKIDPTTGEVVDEYASVREASIVNYYCKHTIARAMAAGRVLDGYIYKVEEGKKRYA